jgi:glycosyltransferase involved in cell wall biosynthesis
MPSYFEGLALASTEALGFGLPLIISNIPEFEDIKRENFILIKGFGPNEIYEALYESSILENRSIEKMRSNSIDKFNNDFDSKKMTQNYENIIDYTLKND